MYKGLCALSVTGADKNVPLLPGGLDGRYKLHHCEGGRPAYVRDKSTPARAKQRDLSRTNAHEWLSEQSVMYLLHCAHRRIYSHG